MHARILKPRRGPVLLVKPLRDGDVLTVMSLFERLGDESRRSRFKGPKRCLASAELRELASVDSTHHVLVAYAEGDPQPVAIARLVRDGRSAEIAFAVADAYQQRGIGSTITAELVMDARAVGISEITALVAGDNPAALAVLRRTLKLIRVTFEGPDLSVCAAIS